MHGPHRPLVAVIGSGIADAATIALAEDLGRALAARGLSVLCGGRGGVMEAVSRGLRQQRDQSEPETPAREAVTIGLLPEADRRNANPWLDYAIPTGLGLARNTVVAMGANAVIAISGMSGTLSEIAFAWQTDRPICALSTAGGWAGQLAGRSLDSRRDDVIFAAATPDEAADWAFAVAKPTTMGT